jgi:hypothetical protein
MSKTLADVNMSRPKFFFPKWSMIFLSSNSMDSMLVTMGKNLGRNWISAFSSRPPSQYRSKLTSVNRDLWENCSRNWKTLSSLELWWKNGFYNEKIENILWSLPIIFLSLVIWHLFPRLCFMSLDGGNWEGQAYLYLLVLSLWLVLVKCWRHF